MEKTTVNRDGYYSNMKGERFDVRRPVDSDLLRGDGTFMSETHTGAEFGAKKGERAKQTLHGPSDIWDNDGNQKFESSTVNRSDYGGGGRGERFERRVPVDSDNILSREGTMFEGESITTHEFKPKKGERMDVKRPETSEIWKV